MQVNSLPSLGKNRLENFLGGTLPALAVLILQRQVKAGGSTRSEKASATWPCFPSAKVIFFTYILP
jgi:hypothetical protein